MSQQLDSVTLKAGVRAGGHAYGLEHYAIALSLGNQADLARRQGDAARAEDCYRRSIVLKERVLGSEHPEVAHALGNQATLYAEQGRVAEADCAYRRALSIFDAALPPDHPHRVRCRESYEALHAPLTPAVAA